MTGGTEALISRYGAAASLAAVVTVFAGAYLALGENRATVPLLVLLYAVGAAEIIVLCRVTMPGWLRGVEILFIIASLTTLAARTDVFGLQRVGAAIPDVVVAAPAERTVAGAPASDPRYVPPAPARANAASGAKVVFVPRNAGDDGWARMLNTVFDGRLGGAQASWLMISGTVAETRIGSDINVQLRWDVSADGRSAQCGSTSALGSSYPALLDQFRRDFSEALSRSVQLRQVACP